MYQYLENAQLSLADAAGVDTILQKMGSDFSLELLDGFFTGLLVGPKAIQANDALMLLSGALQPGLASEAEVAQLGSSLIELFETRQAIFAAGDDQAEGVWLPLLRTHVTQDVAADTALTVAKSWSEGFLLATSIHSDLWTTACEKVESISDCATLINALTDNIGKDGNLTEEKRQVLIDSLPIAIQTIEQYWRPLRSVRTIIKDPKISRNDACPCGSGKKYKKCCGV